MKKLALSLALLGAAACRPAQPPAPPAPAPSRPEAAPTAAVEAPKPAPAPIPALPEVHKQVVLGRLQSGEILAKALTRLGVDSDQQREVLGSLAGVFDFKRAKAGDELMLTFDGRALLSLVYKSGALDEWRAARDGDRWVARKKEVLVEKKVVRVEVAIQSSLYESLQKAGADPELAINLADVFAWDIDFYTDVQADDQVRAVVEEYVANGKIVRYGEVLGAEYVGKTVGKKRIFRYADPRGEVSYFNADGTSARKAFLKSPLKYAHVTSGFGLRTHPVLHNTQAHQGVDYAAPVGTPVWAVGDGVVTWAGMKGPNGNMVCLHHRNGLDSCYCHLSGYGEGVKVGAHVAQKKVIAFSGNTGLSTGPHLHYALKRNGAFLNPLTLKMPPAEPIPAKLLGDFHGQIDPISAQLNPTPVAQVEQPK